ncbi:MAG: hypothetical protein O2954_07625 [bacterium]|nr:hypothetical protein [bacterium]
MPTKTSKTEATPSNDSRPNSGMREGGIPHAEVNAVLRTADKTVIFGQQNRLRNGLLMEDEKLTRFHAGHDLVKFFYQGLRKLPERLLDALLENNISATLVTGKDLLVFHDVRAHQSFHIGYTRKTIYMPEGVLREAIDKGYDSWAVAEVLIRETWPLLNYMLLLEFIRHARMRLRTHATLGSPTIVKNALRYLNKHLTESDKTEDSEFNAFYRHYCNDMYGLGRSILNEDPYLLADRIFDEHQERIWANLKLDEITKAFDYPTVFDLDRDIVHPAAFRAAEIRSLPVEPQTTEDILHDLTDAARFNILRQTRTDQLLDMLINKGESGILRFIDIISNESATDHHVITLDYHDGYDTLAVFKEKIQALSTSPPEGLLGSICNEFRDLLGYQTRRNLHALFQKFSTLPAREQRSNRPYLKTLLYRIIDTAALKSHEDKPMLQDQARRSKDLRYLTDMAGQLLGSENPELKHSLILNILKKLDRHPAYHTTILNQVQALTGDQKLSLGDNIREQADTLFNRIPDRPYRLSSDPHRLRACLDRYHALRKNNPDSDSLLSYLAGIFIRLDRTENYTDHIETVRLLGEPARPALQEVIDTINRNDEKRHAILQTAQNLLDSLS